MFTQDAIFKTFTYLSSSTLLHNKDIIHNQHEIVEDMQGDLIKKNVQKVVPRSSLILDLNIVICLMGMHIFF